MCKLCCASFFIPRGLTVRTFRTHRLDVVIRPRSDSNILISLAFFAERAFSRWCVLDYLLQDESRSLDIEVHDCALVNFCTVVLSITSVIIIIVCLFYFINDKQKTVRTFRTHRLDVVMIVATCVTVGMLCSSSSTAPPKVSNEYQLRLYRSRQVCFILLADNR